MMRYLEWLFATLGGLLGALHVALTAVLYRHASLDALWFGGTGLGIAAVAVVNMVGLRAGDRSSPKIILAANTAMAAYFGYVWTFMNAPQVALGFVLFAGLAVCSAVRALKVPT